VTALAHHRDVVEVVYSAAVFDRHDVMRLEPAVAVVSLEAAAVAVPFGCQLAHLLPAAGAQRSPVWVGAVTLLVSRLLADRAALATRNVAQQMPRWG
jgi:hypothetical protein